MKRMQSEYKNVASESFSQDSFSRPEQTAGSTDQRRRAQDALAPARAWLRSLKRRAIAGLLLLVGLFLLYRFIWLAGWYWPYRLIIDYLSARIPMAEPWLIETVALVACALLIAQAGTIVSFVLFGRQKKAMVALIIIGALVHGALGWYSYGRVVVDERGRVRVRVVERPDGALKVIDGDFDPETGKRARRATDNDLVMLDLQRRGMQVRQVSPGGPFRSAQGTINVYYTRRSDRIVLYTGPRHPEVSGDMQLATEEILREFLSQQRQK